MKMRYLLAFISLTALYATSSATCLRAQEEAEPPYGRVALVALFSESDPERVAFDLASETAGILDAHEKVLVEFRYELHRDEADLSRLIAVAREMDVSDLAVFEFDQSESVEFGFAEVTLLRLAGRWEAKPMAVVGQPVVPLLSRIRWLAGTVAARLTQIFSKGAEVHVVLTLRTDPATASYTFGPSLVQQTDANGYGLWQGTSPVGPRELRVFKDPDYREFRGTVNVVREDPYFKRSFRVWLHPTDP
jgi:hypothetical protein